MALSRFYLYRFIFVIFPFIWIEQWEEMTEVKKERDGGGIRKGPQGRPKRNHTTYGAFAHKTTDSKRWRCLMGCYMVLWAAINTMAEEDEE